MRETTRQERIDVVVGRMAATLKPVMAALMVASYELAMPHNRPAMLAAFRELAYELMPDAAKVDPAFTGAVEMACERAFDAAAEAQGRRKP